MSVEIKAQIFDCMKRQENLQNEFRKEEEKKLKLLAELAKEEEIKNPV